MMDLNERIDAVMGEAAVLFLAIGNGQRADRLRTFLRGQCEDDASFGTPNGADVLTVAERALRVIDAALTGEPVEELKGI